MTDKLQDIDQRHSCPHCSHGYFEGSETECVNGVLIDVDEAHEGWQRDVSYPAAPCEACTKCQGSGQRGRGECRACNGTGWKSGRNESQERLEALRGAATDEAIRCAVSIAIDSFPGMLHSEKIDAVLAAVGPALVAAERERCASLEGAVMTSLSANGSVCACGNGRVPVKAYHDACAAFAAAIRAGVADGG